MKTYRLLKSILLKDGKKYAVNLVEWGNLTLQGSELNQFKTDMDNLQLYYDSQVNNGNLSYSELTEQVTLSDNTTNSIKVGLIFSESDNYVVPVRETEWYDKMSRDPNLIKFNTKELEE